MEEELVKRPRVHMGHSCAGVTGSWRLGVRDSHREARGLWRAAGSTARASQPSLLLEASLHTLDPLRQH